MAGRPLTTCVRCAALVATALLGALAGAGAAPLEVTATLDADQVTLDQSVELTVTLRGSGLNGAGEPELPAFDGLRLIGTSTEQSFSIVNGAVSSTHTYHYILQPTRTGKLTLPPVRVSVGGKQYATPTLTLTVTPRGGSARSSRGMNQPLLPSATPWPQLPDPFGPGAASAPDPREAVAVRHSVDRKRAYVGQQITYTFGFYQAEQLTGDVDYQPAATPGFVAENLPNPANTNEVLNGRTYAVQRRKKALFATTPGPHTIGKASVTVTLDPFSGPTELVAPPLVVTVLPLPTQGRPPGFGGAVGQFRVTLSADRQAVRAGETINLQVQVTGNGNLRSLAAPQLNLPSWARVYPAGETRKAEAGGAGNPEAIGGTATFTYLILPRQPGTLTLGPVRYPYFDPVAGTYRLAESNTLRVSVAPGTATDTAPPTADALRPLHTGPTPRLRPPVTAHLGFWIALGLPLVVVGAAGWRRRRLISIATAPLQARAHSALRLAQTRLRQAAGCARQADCEGCYAELQAALTDYVADRLGAPPAGLTADTVHQRLLAAGCAQPLADEVRALLEAAAAGRYAPGGADPDRAAALVHAAEQLLRRLQAEVTVPHA